MHNKKIWAKKSSKKLNPFIEKFTIDTDQELDSKHFIYYDIKGTCAHVSCLNKIGILNNKEASILIDLLLKLEEEVLDDSDRIYVGEDSHTVIENYLIENAGDVGKKVHIGRSRNDQVLTAIRLYMKDKLEEIYEYSNVAIATFKKFSEKYRNMPFIGYSHTQQAMLTTLGHYFDAYREELSDDQNYIYFIIQSINKSPLGSAAGFGSAIDLDRQFSAELLNFKTVQNNSLYCQNSRGKFEIKYLHALSQMMLTLSRLASDMLLYTSREFSFFNVDDIITTGSSIMPQKKNLDVFEIIRGKHAELISLENKAQLILKNLTSGYHRDFQLIKGCLVDAYEIIVNSLYAIDLCLHCMLPNKQNILNRIEKDIYAADAATIKSQEENIPFRDAYQQVADNKFNFKPEDIINKRISKGSPGNY